MRVAPLSRRHLLPTVAELLLLAGGAEGPQHFPELCREIDAPALAALGRCQLPVLHGFANLGKAFLKSPRDRADIPAGVMQALRHVVRSVLDGGLTADDPRYHDVAFMRRLRAGALSALALLAIVPPMAVFYVALGAPVAAAAVVANGVLGVLALLFARRRPG